MAGVRRHVLQRRSRTARAAATSATSGIAGVQRQQHINDTGWIGKTTFNTLRSMRVPDGLPHAGEMAMDATAARLIDEAWEMFGGHEPAADRATAPSAQAALERAKTQIGVKEDPPDRTTCKYGEWYGIERCPLVRDLLHLVLRARREGRRQGLAERSSRAAATPTSPTSSATPAPNRYGLTVTGEPDPRRPRLLRLGSATASTTTSASSSGGCRARQTLRRDRREHVDRRQPNGGQVMRRNRSRGSQGTAFVRVAEP